MFKGAQPSEAVRLELIRAATRLTEKHLEMRERLFPLQAPEQQDVQRLELWAVSYITTIWGSMLDQLEREWHRHVQGDHWPPDL
ncbi:hypothetical protein HLH34_04280 [Gluconacetobacter azotocaptans]|uniref:Uncharacterized protein n=1 Tax=Gluconacetobacter azotocaptans TaxID=142834 RepID=A0A7W4PFR7_9PROT|nr:hypothetical protein [Gluconacetobacter azotocaptans]MBB2189181.1 hypothetical protein [Gluconacetobacter azotocaptans]GBQ32170.1 hypothetical protein AA13594_2290 [Gluconacetobacter azotocaptans DSM 13594]